MPVLQDFLSLLTAARVYAPAGLDLGSETPEEIALSVMSEIVLLRGKGTGAPMRDLPRGPAREPAMGEIAH